MQNRAVGRINQCQPSTCRSEHSMSDAHPFPEATYHDNYSEDEEDDPNSSKKGEEDDSEDGDFVKHPQEPITTLQPPHKKRRLSLEERGPSNVQNESPRLDITISPLNSPSRAADTALEPSIINAEPIDEFIREIADWMAYQCRGKRNIEARLSHSLSRINK